MTISTKTIRCEWCGGEFDVPRGPGRPPRYCRRSHRQRAYEARRIAGERGIGREEVLVSLKTWVSLRDALYRLETAYEDVAMDLRGGRATRAEYVEAMTHLASAVRDLQAVSVEPLAFSE